MIYLICIPELINPEPTYVILEHIYWKSVSDETIVFIYILIDLKPRTPSFRTYEITLVQNTEVISLTLSTTNQCHYK